jgi:hypothetical protein
MMKRRKFITLLGAATGPANVITAAPPSSVMNSRRFKHLFVT